MKYIKSFNESTGFITNREEILKILNFYLEPGVEYTIGPDGTIDVHLGGVGIGPSHLIPKTISKLPIRFGRVEGYFSLRGFDLNTLEGCPHTCGRFDLSEVKVANLIGGPQIVEGSYDLEDCKVHSLIGAPMEVENYFDCDSTLITSLEGAPKRVGGFFRCSRTKITDLKGGPDYIGGGLYVSYTNLESFEGAPKKCEFIEIKSGWRDISPDSRHELDFFDDLDHAPLWNPIHLRDTKLKFIHSDSSYPFYELLSLFNNRIKSYEDLPFSIKSEVTQRFLESLDYFYLRGDRHNPKVNLFRLQEALQEFDLELPTDKDTLENYTLVDDDGRAVDFNGNIV